MLTLIGWVMSDEGQFSWEQVKGLADTLVFNSTSKHLTDIEVQVLQGAYQGESYEKIAETLGFTTDYINKDVGYKLWKKLSEGLGEKVTKKNFRQALSRKQMIINKPSLIIPLEFPEGAVGLDSQFYVERLPVEVECYKEILKPGAIIRIKAPRRMGKTSLLNRIIDYAEKQSYRTVRINIRQAEKSLFSDLDKFLRWFCTNITRQLDLEVKLDNYWYEFSGSKVNCTSYFEEYLFEQLNTNLVIGLDEIDAVFNYPDIAEDFLGLLRECHEEAMINHAWQKLRIVMAYSTEAYIPLNINHSPFNVGLPLKLPLFSQQQIEDLAVLHGLNWRNRIEAEQLIALVGGHPYLIRLALYYLSLQKVSLPQLLQDAPTHAGIYSDHLRRYLEYIHGQPELVIALNQVVTNKIPTQLKSMSIYKLDSMGLINLNGNMVEPSCELYRQYFSANLC